MANGGMSLAAMAVATILAVALALQGARAQTGAPACAQKLVDCTSDIGKTTTPSSECCKAIKDSVATELPCLCALLKDEQLLQAFKVNVSQALELPKRCSVSSDSSICDTAVGAPSAPPATPGKDRNAAAVVRMGASSAVAVITWAFWWSVVA